MKSYCDGEEQMKPEQKANSSSQQDPAMPHASPTSHIAYHELTQHTWLLTWTRTLTEHHLLAGLGLWHRQFLPFPSFFLDRLETGKVFPEEMEKVISHMHKSLVRNS